MAARVIIALLLHLLFLNTAYTFNVDIKDPYTFTRAADKYFGYSVAMMKPNWLIVGAPKADNGVGKLEHGVVFKCDLSSNGNSCTKMTNFDTLPTRQINDNGTTRDSDIKNGQMFGATVRAFNTHVMACAPRYINAGDLGQNAWTTGKCEIRDENNPDEDKVWNPCLIEISKSAQFGYCQVGLDAAVTPNLQNVVSGAIGINYWMGRLVYSTIDSTGSVYPVTPGLTGSAYMGYAVTAGIFTKDKQYGIVGGAPRGNAMEGLVQIYYPKSSQFVSMATLANPAKQGGSYFGGSLAAPDLNGDGYSDLVVGASFFSVKYNEGAVYVYINNKDNSLGLVATPLFGDSEQGAQFGHALANVGDLNGDLFEDLAVGAPYGGPDKKGVVYLYYGARDGIKTKYSQKLEPSQFGGNQLTFGFSLVGGVDIDNNGYQDLVVGSYASNSAVYFRSRPVINVFGAIKLNMTKISLTNSKSICIAPDGKQYKCVGAELCFDLLAKSGPVSGNVNYTFQIDKERVADKRGFVMVNGKRQTSVSGTVPISAANTCLSHIVYVHNKTRDVFFPLVFDMAYSYVEPDPCNLCGISNSFLPSSVQARVAYVKGCGNDDICQADLKLFARAIIPGDLNEIQLGVVDTFTVEVTVSNTGENAYLSTLSIIHDSSISITAVNSKTDFNPLWEVVRLVGQDKSRLYFSIGNPLTEDKEQVLEIKMNVDQLPYLTTDIKLELSATTESTDINTGNEHKTLNLKAITIADITISGNAFPEQIKYFSNVTSAATRGTTLLQTVLVQNQGPSVVQSSKLLIRLPDVLDNEYLLNLLSVQVDGDVTCKFDASIIDPLGLANKTNNGTSVTKRLRRATDTDCKTAVCRQFTCEIGSLQRGQSVTVKLTSSVVEFTFIKQGITSTRLLLYASVTTQGITQPPGHLKDEVQIPVVIQEYGIGDGGTTSRSVPWWVIFLSILAGAILIAACIYLLYKKGFFERTKHEQVPQNDGDADLEDF